MKQRAVTDGDTFEGRRWRYLQRAAAAGEQWYTADGDWRPALPEPAGARERFWLAGAFYETGRERLADALIERAEVGQSHAFEHDQDQGTFDIFHTNIACVMLKNFAGRMSSAAREKLSELVRVGFRVYHGNRRPDYQFHGHNDNMPSKASMGLILGGEMFGCPEAVAHGLWNLRQLAAMLRRRGTVSEWNSPTYSPLTVQAIAEIAEHAADSEARELAAKIEERLWLDLAARFHPGLGLMAGPHSRTYIGDFLGRVTGMSVLLWLLLGEVSRGSPMEFFDGGTADLATPHPRDLAFGIASSCWPAIGVYHLSDTARRLLLEKTYPFHAVATAEMGAVSSDFPARVTRTESFLQPDFSVGTASTPLWDGGPGMQYFVTYRRVRQPRSFRDNGTLYHRLFINDEVPGALRYRAGSSVAADGDEPMGEQVVQITHANAVTVQDGPTTLMLTHPQQGLGGVDDKPPLTLTKIHELLVFPSHFGGAEEIIVGGEPRAAWAGPVPRGAWVGCRRGRLLFAARPLAYRADGQQTATVPLTLERINHYEVLRANFYAGPGRTFTRPELLLMFGGFVAEHASVDEYPSLSAFIKDLAGAKFTDYYWQARRVRYRRPATTRRPAAELEIFWSPGSTAPRYATVSGQPVPMDERVTVSGLNERDFPLLNEPWQSIPPHFPWPHFNGWWGGPLLKQGYVGDADC